MNWVKQAKQAQSMADREEWRQKSLARLDLIQPGDLTRIFGLMCQVLGERRREAELDVLRSERFHAEAEMLPRYEEQRADYDRRLEITSGIFKMLSAFDGEEALKDYLQVWAKKLPLWRDGPS